MTCTFETYLASLSGLSAHADPTLATSHSMEIRDAAASLAAVPEITPRHWLSGQAGIRSRSLCSAWQWGCPGSDYATPYVIASVPPVGSRSLANGQMILSLCLTSSMTWYASLQSSATRSTTSGTCWRPEQGAERQRYGLARLAAGWRMRSRLWPKGWACRTRCGPALLGATAAPPRVTS